MDNPFAQVIGFLGAIAYFIVFQQKRRSLILALSVAASSFFVLHFILLGAYTGAAMNAVSVFRSIIYYFNDKKFFSGKAWLALFIGVSVISCALTWNDAFSLFPLFSMTTTSVSFWLKNERYIRLVTLPTSPSWFIYNFHTHSIAGMITEIIIASSLVISIIRYDIMKKDTKSVKEADIHENTRCADGT